METRRRRRRIMAISVALSAALHVLVLSLLFFAFRAVITPQGAERIGETTTITVERRAPATPAPKPRHPRPTPRVRPATQPPAFPAARPVHEIAKQVAAAAAQPLPRRRAATVTTVDRDRALFAGEVAKLNRDNAAHAIPTIDPAAAQPSSKSYAFDAASRSGNEHGNGIITPVTSWQDAGRDCYYARYSYTYPSGAMESGNIVWPVCFDPATDPFHRPPHPMPFPLPLAGFRLTPGTQLPPLEKAVYDEWAAGDG